MRTLLTAAALLFTTACSHAGAARPHPAATSQGSQSPMPGGWTSPLHREHPLTGRIWDVKAARFVDAEALRGALTQARFVVLGERHDQPDHHQLQAWLVQALATGDKKPALAFEMLDVGQQPAVDASLAQAPRDADALALAVNWAGSGWPDWALYRPVFAAGLEAGLPIVAANLPRSQVRDLVMRGPEALAPGLRQRLSLDTPLPEPVEQAMRQEQDEAHCGHLPKEMLGPMVQAQRARDAHLADRLSNADTGQGGVLITGNGHARTDRGVPAQLAARAHGKDVRAVGLLEVDPKLREPADYAASFGAQSLPFDYVWFTPAMPMEDPCAALLKRPKK
ncbi:ChaN family lipoprotein [Myxococcus xanthus]|uniref:ChaN family lipoprotein n=1 Tax=Myxococcus xanthus TaxID=34 RepID=A0A7Y4IJN7_MYXXA|nr:ChaN family lipoprotein [Myxococcus xanthus]NOJ80513.1 ChaN family lipoprotein [Myxococcus xanthus]NOJ84368.1 ChaN family lipoprotein [Myxococcus xanthus]